jgi:predicted MPP superfamily phosphohydrolase
MSRIIFIAIFLILIDLMAFQAVRHMLTSSGKTLRTAVFIAYWLIPVISVIYLAGLSDGWSDHLPRTIQVIVRAMIFILYFAKLLMAAIILVDDIRRLAFGALNISFDNVSLSTVRSSFMSYGALILGTIPILSLTYGMARNPYRYKVLKTRVPVKNLHPSLKGLKIVQISDIHSGSFLFKEPVARSIEMINAEKPDIVFFTGDLVNTMAREMEPFVDIFSQIQAPLGVYSVLGNHDYGDYHQWPSQKEKQQNFEELKDMHRKLGWRLLLNEHEQIQVKDTFFNVIGVENYSASARFVKHGDLRLATEGMNKDTFNILLSHDPSHWNDQVTSDYPEIDLTLSGHTHGFQFGVEIPGFVKWSPVQYVYPQWAGLYRESSQYLYVNRGLGFLGYPGRVGILPEITVLELDQS